MEIPGGIQGASDVSLWLLSPGPSRPVPPKASVVSPSSMFSPPCQLSLKPGSQSLRSGNWSERKSHRLPRLPKRHSHDDMLLLAQLSLPSSPSSLNEDSLSTTSELLSSRRARRIPKVVSPDRVGWAVRQAGGLLSLPSFP